mgnify:CR=1 FL=1
MRKSAGERMNGVTGAGPRQRATAFAPATSVAFLLVPRFSMIAFASALEPLRLANRTAGRPLYSWTLHSADGAAVRASSDIEIGVNGDYGAVKSTDLAVVCAGIDVETHAHRELISALRRLASFGARLGAVCTGTYVLAKAGLLNGYQSTIHWENHPSLITEFPSLEVTLELFEIDRNRLTCAGGTAAADMMLSMISRDHGPALAAEVADQLIHHRIREADERQRMDLRLRLGVAHPKLLAVVARMEEAIEQPRSCAELADEACVSTRQLERLFARYLGMSPTRYYLTLRLERARQLLRQTSQPVLSVAMSCGFVSASHFSKSYNERFGHTPTAERVQAHDPTAAHRDLARRRKPVTPVD